MSNGVPPIICVSAVKSRRESISKLFNGVEVHFIDVEYGTTTPEICRIKGHMNAMKHVVDNSLQSAMIIEDDVMAVGSTVTYPSMALTVEPNELRFLSRFQASTDKIVSPFDGTSIMDIPLINLPPTYTEFACYIVGRSAAMLYSVSPNVIFLAQLFYCTQGVKLSVMTPPPNQTIPLINGSRAGGTLGSARCNPVMYYNAKFMDFVTKQEKTTLEAFDEVTKDEMHPSWQALRASIAKVHGNGEECLISLAKYNAMWCAYTGLDQPHPESPAMLIQLLATKPGTSPLFLA